MRSGVCLALLAVASLYAAAQSPSPSPSSAGWRQTAYLKAASAGEGDQFGYAVALSGDGNTLAVGAPMENSAATGVGGSQADDSADDAGAVYVYVRRGSGWEPQAYIKASNAETLDQFGNLVALSADGNMLAVGAPSEDSAANQINGDQADDSAMGAGAAYVFARRGTSWTQQAYIKAANAHGGMLFGYSVGLSADGGVLAVGAYDERGCSNVINGPYEMTCGGTGAAYVFARDGTTWSQDAYVKAREQDRGDSLGGWLAVSDDGSTVAVGAHDEDSLTTGVNAVQSGHSGRVGSDDDNSSGAAYVFVRTGRTWSQQASFKASNAGRQDWFGSRFAVSGDGDTLSVAAPNEDGGAKGLNGRQDDDSAVEAGAVYVFIRDASTWTHQVYVKGSNTEEFDEFGSSVALSRDGRTMAVGARFEDGSGRDERDNSLIDAGAVYVFTRE
jgi:hypothetical protein